MTNNSQLHQELIDHFKGQNMKSNKQLARKYFKSLYSSFLDVPKSSSSSQILKLMEQLHGKKSTHS